MAIDFSRMTVVELRQELKRRNLPQNGKKADLIDRLVTFESDRTSPEPRDDSVEDDHEANGSPPEKGVAEEQDTALSPLPREEDSAEAPHPSTAEAAAQTPITNQDTDSTPAAAIEPAESAEVPVPAQDLAPKDVDEAANTTPIPATEIITDTVSRKRRSRSPPPEIESSRKRARPSNDRPGEENIPLHTNNLRSQATREYSPVAQPVPTPQTAAEIHATTLETSPFEKEDHHEPTEERNWQHHRAPTPQRYQEQSGDSVDEPIPEFERDVAPAQHPATSALYIKNFMRPLREPMLQDYLVDLAALPGAAPDPSCLVDFHLDQIRTHALVSFTSVSAASRVRTALHGTVWPNERNRKELWADFIPEDKVAEWIERERSEGGRSNRWEVHYEPDEEGIITASLVNAEMEPIRRNSTRQPLGPPPVPTGPARSYPGVEGAPLGPRGRGTNHYRQAQMPASTVATAGDRDRNRDYNDNNDRNLDYKTTRAYPSIQYKPVPEDVAKRRLDNMNAHITRDRRRDLGRPDEINRYTFEDGDMFVDRGKEAFVGIRHPYRENNRRRAGMGRGGGNRGPPRRRTPSPRRPVRDDGGYRGGRRNDYDRSYRDRDDDRRDRRDDRDRDFGRDRYRDEVPRSRFDGQPLPTFGGGGGRGGRWGGGGGGRRDRF
ncbi:hypothetical protein CHGG_04513 [Chaetomium globosum CBS 148.51]|uniref:SAP domain-containing protein n=1 Tax=Chaetomium globosum (strain ATCC 6205 / CBS 148.51 / DSM 1962 / NBRC 6347 / NRRL 1970) TaxID=306901 RepID=Q2H133_CHAGB|nr:uncharacterized protein CHGG_04513 [Chaetomium globosum CBS 148.51]EAQ87894.1 hypothetical protein CHGG_04513 [Chaetomium globosum CBS 148.51]